MNKPRKVVMVKKHCCDLPIEFNYMVKHLISLTEEDFLVDSSRKYDPYDVVVLEDSGKRDGDNVTIWYEVEDSGQGVA